MLAQAALAGLVFEHIKLTEADNDSLNKLIDYPDRSIITRAHEDRHYMQLQLRSEKF